MISRIRWSWMLLGVLALFPAVARAQTAYAVVFGDQSKVVGASTLNSGLFRSADSGRTWKHLGPENLKAFSMDAVESARGRILFIAAGNGVHRSLDSGRTWRVVTDWRVTEVLDVAVKQDDPRWVYAATAYGLWYSNDTGATWRPARDTVLGGYSYRLMIDGSRILVACESGVFVVGGDSGAERLPALLPRGFVREVVSPKEIIVLQRNGLFYLDAATLKVDSTLSVGRGVPSDGLPQANWYDGLVETNSKTLCGDSGVWRLWTTEARNNGLPSVWQDYTEGLPTRVVHSLVAIGGELLAGTWGGGVWRRGTGTWAQSGLEGCQVWRLVVKEW